MDTGLDFYAELGIDPSASNDEIRRAWVQAARLNHPDTLLDASVAVRLKAEERMQCINEAWRVLGSEELKASYDHEYRRKIKQADRLRSNEFPIEDLDAKWEMDEGDSETAPLLVTSSWLFAFFLRVLPWLTVGFIGVGIFVFSAFASNSRSQPLPTSRIPEKEECVRLRENDTVRVVPCIWENDGEIVEILDFRLADRCSDENAVLVSEPQRRQRLCLVSVRE
ncbi:MAG: J domain-containing protein [Actinomycetota bacterium]|nr:J domain-containing protein [Acidimicrobiales bacterium]